MAFMEETEHPLCHSLQTLSLPTSRGRGREGARSSFELVAQAPVRGGFELELRSDATL
jgi:hypothetical protein